MYIAVTIHLNAKAFELSGYVSVIGRFNWLSHAYYNKNVADYVLLRDETSVVVNDKNVINKIIDGLNIAQN